jgi:hypothetical protein
VIQDALGSVNMSRYIQLLSRYLRPNVFRVGLLGVCLMGSIGLQLFIPQIVRSFIDLATPISRSVNSKPVAFREFGVSIRRHRLESD